MSTLSTPKKFLIAAAVAAVVATTSVTFLPVVGFALLPALLIGGGLFAGVLALASAIIGAGRATIHTHPSVSTSFFQHSRPWGSASFTAPPHPRHVERHRDITVKVGGPSRGENVHGHPTAYPAGRMFSPPAAARANPVTHVRVGPSSQPAPQVGVVYTHRR